jgi:branched-subunit amino acid aminotransferase/4-amino-4-deoxychorismate lyase
MAIKASEFVWHNGHLIPWDDAKVHVMAHVVNYGSSVFEGIRCYQTPKGPAIFRLQDHALRLMQSCKVYRIDLDYSLEELVQGTIDVVAANKVSPCYIRPASIPSIRQPRFISPTTNGASIWAPPIATMGLRCASHRGRVWRPIPCRPWPKPAPIT